MSWLYIRADVFQMLMFLLFMIVVTGLAAPFLADAFEHSPDEDDDIDVPYPNRYNWPAWLVPIGCMGYLLYALVFKHLL